MPQFDLTLARAAATFVDEIHRSYPGIRITPVPRIEDEDFTLEVAIPKAFSFDEVLEACHRVCIRVEDEHDFFILPHVVFQ
jgi:hypothetical protein